MMKRQEILNFIKDRWNGNDSYPIPSKKVYEKFLKDGKFETVNLEFLPKLYADLITELNEKCKTYEGFEESFSDAGTTSLSGIVDQMDAADHDPNPFHQIFFISNDPDGFPSTQSLVYESTDNNK